MMWNKRRRLARGMTLMEVLLAITICSIALVVMSNVIVAANRTTTKGDYYNVATEAASDKLVELETTPFDSLAEGSSSSLVYGLPGTSNQMTWTVGPLDGNSANTDIEQVDIVVTWTGPTGAKQVGGQIKMSTLISNV